MRTYERLTMLAKIMTNVYINKEWIVKEYLRRCKEGAWKEENTNEVLKCWNLECILDAELLGKQMPPELTLEDLINGGTSSSVNSGNDDSIMVG